jgi:glycerate-2-kinase
VTAIDAPAAAGRALALELYDAAVTAAAPGPATARAVDALPIERGSRLWIFAFGKAARPMAAAAVTSTLRSLHSIVGGLIVAPDDATSPYPTIVSMRGDHPLPGRHSFDASAKIAEIASGRRGSDVAIVLLSGGASSLIGAPVRAINESDFVVLQELLLGSGLDIAATNLVRKRFSRWGAGRLALALAPATTHCLAISDVAGDDLSVIGSGPCIPDGSSVADVTNLLQRANLFARLPAACRDYLTGVTRGTVPETPAKSHPAFAHITGRVIGNNRLALDGVASKAEELRLAASIAPERLEGEAARAGEAIARALVDVASQGANNACFAWGGETTVTLVAPNGAAAMGGGGRCQELALAAARVLHQAGGDAAGIALLAAGTDGRDGATDAAGAIVDHTTWSAVAEGGRDPAQSLAAHESYKALRAASALIPRRDTGTNVNDVVVGVIVR